MDTATGRRLAQRQLVTNPMDVDISSIRIDALAAIESGLQAIKPHNAVSNWALCEPFPCESDWPSSSENCSNRFPASNLVRNAMQSKGRLVGPSPLADSESGCGNTVSAFEFVTWNQTRSVLNSRFLMKFHFLSSNCDTQNELRRLDRTRSEKHAERRWQTVETGASD